MTIVYNQTIGISMEGREAVLRRRREGMAGTLIFGKGGRTGGFDGPKIVYFPLK